MGVYEDPPTVQNSNALYHEMSGVSLQLVRSQLSKKLSQSSHALIGSNTASHLKQSSLSFKTEVLSQASKGSLKLHFVVCFSCEV